MRFKACSDEVGEALGPDGMKSVVHLIPDMLQAGLPILIYEGDRLCMHPATYPEPVAYFCAS